MSYTINSPFRKDFANEVLIEEVKIRPALYDKNCREYGDQAYKKLMWEEICEKLYPTWHTMDESEKNQKGRDVVKRWNNLRTCFTRELKIMRDPLTKKRHKYLYFDKLTFLVDENAFLVDENASQHQECKEIESNFMFSKSNSSFENIKEEPASFSDEAPESIESKTTKRKRSKFRERRKDGEHTQYSDNEEESFENRTEDAMPVETGMTLDTDVNFALSLVPTLKMVPLRMKIDAQIEILSVLKKYTKNIRYNSVKIERHDEQTTDEESEIA